MSILKYKWLFFAISLIVIIPGLISLALFGLKPSIDFTGGTLLEIAGEGLTSQLIKNEASAQSLELSSLQLSSDNVYLLRFKHITAEENEKFKAQLASSSGEVKENRFETVGPVVGKELTQKSVMAVVLASIAIVVYMAWSFRRIPKPYSPWKFGLCAVVALVHDAVVVLGVFSLLGHFLGVEVDGLFVTALLTVIGFSVHDSIVVFDRVRENLLKMSSESFSAVVDFSLIETLVRSLNTSMTVILTLTALLLFGGESIRWFIVALLVGILSGTYSSIFNAAPLLALWEEKHIKN